MNKGFKYKNKVGTEFTFSEDMYEDIVSSENSKDNEKKCWVFEKKIDFTELLGTQIQLFFKANNIEIINGIYTHQLIKMIKRVNFEFYITKMNIFEHETKKAI